MVTIVTLLKDRDHQDSPFLPQVLLNEDHSAPDQHVPHWSPLVYKVADLVGWAMEHSRFFMGRERSLSLLGGTGPLPKK